MTPKFAVYAAALATFVIGVDFAAILEASFPLRLSIALVAVVLACVLAGLARRTRGTGS